MLIIPIDNKPDWRRPPLLCFALILVNLLVFAFYQSEDGRRWEAAENYYFSSDLPDYEEQQLLIYIDELHPEWRLSLDGDGEDFVYNELLWNIEFHHWLMPRLQGPEHSTWRAQREAFGALRDRVSSFAFGLQPAELDLAGVLGHMFLHGSWDHLIGNMIFLLLFGLSVELALGGRWFLGLYLLGGVAAAGLHAYVEAGSYVPMVGASGAVSAVMGMFVAVYGIRQLRFFYTVGFLFGEFSAPALLVLPLWLAKEVFGYLYGAENVAYWAHFGGLLAGFYCALGLVYHRGLRHSMPVESDPQPVTAESAALTRIERLQSAGRLQEAGRAAFDALRQFPESVDIVVKAIDLNAIAPAGEAYHRANLALFALARDPKVDIDIIAARFDQYLKRTPVPRALTDKACLLLARRAVQAGKWRWLETLFKRLSERQVRHPQMASFGMALVQHHRRMGEELRARELLQMTRALQVAD